LAQFDDAEKEDKKAIKQEDEGIYYKPDIDYEPEDIPAHKYAATESISSEAIKKDIANESNLRNTHAKIDFLIDKCEDKLSKYEGFEDFRKAVIKKMFCQVPLSNKEKRHINDFKEKLDALEKKEDDEDGTELNIEDKVSNYKPNQAQKAIDQARENMDAELSNYDINI